MARRRTDRGEGSQLSAAESRRAVLAADQRDVGAGHRSQSIARPESHARTRKFPHKVSFYQDPEDTARVRAALLHTQGSEGGRSLSAFIHAAVMKETRRLERKYNDGQPWSGVDARGIPQGRPLDS